MTFGLKASADGLSATIQVGGVDKLTVDNTGKVTADSFAGNGDLVLPTQTGNSGKFLTTNGSAASWGVVNNWSPSVQPYQTGRYYTPFGSNYNGSCGSAIYSGKIVLIPFFCQYTTTFTAMSAHVNTLIAAKTVRLGIYNDNNGVPGSLLIDAGTFSFASVGQKDVSMSQQLQGNTWYWLAALTDATVTGVLDGFIAGIYDPTFSGGIAATTLGGTAVRQTYGSTAYNSYSGTQAYGALPSTLPTISPSISVGVFIALKV